MVSTYDSPLSVSNVRSSWSHKDLKVWTVDWLPQSTTKSHIALAIILHSKRRLSLIIASLLPTRSALVILLPSMGIVNRFNWKLSWYSQILCAVITQLPIWRLLSSSTFMQHIRRTAVGVYSVNFIINTRLLERSLIKRLTIMLGGVVIYRQVFNVATEPRACRTKSQKRGLHEILLFIVLMLFYDSRRILVVIVKAMTHDCCR